MSVYTDNGYNNREDYLSDIAFEYGVDEDAVFMLADVLGPNEDFDGLLCDLEDFCWDF